MVKVGDFMWVFEPYQIVIFSIVGEIIKEFILAFSFDLDFYNFSPIRNYNQWTKINWFGVIMGTLALHIIFPIFAICYWGYKLVTVGRK